MLRVVGQVGSVQGARGAFGRDGADGALVAPGVLLVRVGVDSGDNGCTACGSGRAWRVFGNLVRNGVADCRRFGAVTIALEDLFRGDLGVV